MYQGVVECYNTKIMQRTLVFFTILFLVLGSVFGISFALSYYAYRRQDISSVSINSDSPNQVYKYKKITYFAPVVGIKSYTDNITFNDLRNRQVAILKEDEPALKTLLYDYNVKFDLFTNFDELSRYLNSNIDQVGILNFSNLHFRLKTIRFENIDILDRNSNLLDYKLKYIQELEASSPKTDESNITQTKITTIGHTGSMIPARLVEYYIRNKFNGDFKRLFLTTKPLFDSMDFVSSTFEAPVLGKGQPCIKCMQFVGADDFINAIEYSGIDFFSLASNHIMDGGVEALSNTQRKLSEINIKYTGASVINNDDAAKPVLVEINGLKIAYLAFNDTPGREQWAGKNYPGSANISDWEIDENGNTIKYEPNIERIQYFMQRAKDLNPDLVVVIMHWGGIEYTPQPTDYTRLLAYLLIENGADIIFGDHPHWVQEIEYIQGKPVFYSVGNFIFDQDWSIETMQGMTIEVTLYGHKVINYKLHPHQLDLRQNGTIRLLNPDEHEYKQTLNRVYNVSNLE